MPSQVSHAAHSPNWRREAFSVRMTDSGLCLSGTILRLVVPERSQTGRRKPSCPGRAPDRCPAAPRSWHETQKLVWRSTAGLRDATVRKVEFLTCSASCRPPWRSRTTCWTPRWRWCWTGRLWSPPGRRSAGWGRRWRGSCNRATREQKKRITAGKSLQLTRPCELYISNIRRAIARQDFTSVIVYVKIVSGCK